MDIVGVLGYQYKYKMEQQIDLRKPIIKLPQCGVGGCNNDGWIGLGNRFVCGECIIKVRQIEIEEQFERLKKV